MNTPIFHIESVDLDAQGISHYDDGKVVFIDQALPNELISAEITRKKPSFEKAKIIERLNESTYRVKPGCQHYGVCGGCSMQHMDMGLQIALKQRALEDQLWHLGKVKTEGVLSPVVGPSWHYRHRARLSAKFVLKKNKMLLGFHEKNSSYVADLEMCKILAEPVASMMPRLRELLSQLSIYMQLPQVEIAVGDHTTALVFRIVSALTPQDELHLKQFIDQQTFPLQVWLQPGGPSTINLFHQNSSAPLSYDHPEFGVSIDFLPTDFTQVNHSMNRVLVKKAIDLLDVKTNHRVLDLFCGIGNFTLPLAKRAKEVVGIEGSDALTTRAQQNAHRNQLINVSFLARNLFEAADHKHQQELISLGYFDRWLIDPPREGALALIKLLSQCINHTESIENEDGIIQTQTIVASCPDIRPEKIVYVSCNPSTLARDAGLLVHRAGYRLVSAGISNLFPHTSHVESIAVFERV
jgi:23S rRNA (uracil1939-C5)-methyltransferase